MMVLQILKYQWKNWEPFLYLADGSSNPGIQLMNQNISFTIGEKKCTGFNINGKHYSCPQNRNIDCGWKCDDCKIKDDYFGCMKCSGINCMNSKQRNNCMKNDYYIYLAAFNSLIKVGISFGPRFKQRLVEQGADFTAKIALVEDGMAVRVLESRIKKYLGITDRIRGSQKYDNLFADPNISIKKILSCVAKLKDLDWLENYAIETEIFDLREYYKLQNVLSEPKHISVEKDIKLDGRVVAAKGNIIIFKNDDYYAVNAHDLVGRIITLQ